MRLHILSDLHLELPRCNFVPVAPDADLVILAGDIHNDVRGIEWASQTYAGRPVIYLAGNHEFYGAHWDDLIVRLRRAAEGSNVHFLENDALVVQGVRFIGATLWTDFELFGPLRMQSCMLAAQGLMYDFKRIITGPPARGALSTNVQSPADIVAPSALLEPIQTVERHRVSRERIEALLAEPFAGPTVVVTHHLPSWQSVAVRYQEDPVSAGFASDLESILRAFEPSLWIHGHTHDSFDYRLGKTRVICNPRGYVSRAGTVENAAFKSDLIVDIPG
jgi:predicted phosphodiesterase